MIEIEFVIPFVLFFGVGFAGYLIARRGRARLPFGFFALAVIGFVGLISAAPYQEGYDGLGLIAAALLLVAPSGLGALLGGFIGWRLSK
ncbi:MAG: hypothetical protein AAFV87_07360 [Pseudomonadota bacterium]